MIAYIDGAMDIQSVIGRQLVAVTHWHGKHLAIADAVGVTGQFSVIVGEIPPAGIPTGGNTEAQALCGKPRSRAVRRTQSLLRASTLAPVHSISS